MDAPDRGGADHFFQTIECEFAFDVFPVGFHGFDTQVEACGNLFCFQSLADEPEHSKFTGCEAGDFWLEPGARKFRKHFMQRRFLMVTL